MSKNAGMQRQVTRRELFGTMTAAAAAAAVVPGSGFGTPVLQSPPGKPDPDFGGV